MRKTRSRAFITAAVFAAALASRAHAQDAAVAENPDADRFVTEGIALRAQGRDRDALKAFEKAAEIDPGSVRVQIHLATVYQALGDWLRADDYLTMALARADHPYVNRHRQVLEDAKRVIDANIGRLEVEGGPPGAEIRLNGRLVGTLPLLTPVRATIGSYVLEVRRDGHYSVQRPIVITGGGLVRESIELEPLPSQQAGVAAGARLDAAQPGVDAPANRAWLTWTLGSVAAVAGAVSVGAIIYRESHARRWNDDSRCLGPESTRAELCGGERDKVETGDTVAWVSGIGAGLFATGAVLNALGVFGAEPAPAAVGLQGCGVTLGGAGCFGTF